MNRTTALPVLGLLILNMSGLEGAILLNEVSPSENRIEIINTGEAAVDVANYQLCSLFVYRRLSQLTAESGDLNLAPGSLLVVSGFNLTNSADLGLYRDSAFSSTSSMQDFIQWGSGGNGRESVAVSKGIWNAGVFTELPATGGSISRKSVDGSAGPQGWELVDESTFGFSNTDAGPLELLRGNAFFGNYPWVFSYDDGWLFLLPTDLGLWIYLAESDIWELKE